MAVLDWIQCVQYNSNKDVMMNTPGHIEIVLDVLDPNREIGDSHNTFEEIFNLSCPVLDPIRPIYFPYIQTYSHKSNSGDTCIQRITSNAGQLKSKISSKVV